MGARERLAVWALAGGVMLAACGGAPPSTETPAPSTPTPPRVLVTLTPVPTRLSVGAADHPLGPADAYLTIAHYGDFRCAPCVDVARSLLLLRQRYADDIRIIWRHFVPAGDSAARLAAEAAEAAAAQGRFWEMHDQLLAAQADWRDLPPDQLRAALIGLARDAGVPDLNAVGLALETGQYAPLVERASREALARGYRSAPVLLFRDEPYAGRIDAFGLESYTRLILLERRHFARQPAMIIDLDADYRARLITERGEVTIQLFPRDAPVAVNNFVFLARAGWYDDNTFFLVTPELAQTGDPSDTGLGTAGYFILDEHDNGLIFDREGLVALAHQRGAVNSGSAQFFITFGPLPPEGFNGQYTIFGQVIAGMDVLRQLTPRNPFDPLRFPNPPPGDRLIRVEIVESEPGA
jgi:cyclophilin family peptidyl-prolyl cis-trans isomerase/protein-disulfide isomerase